jgi:hypothetical protein
MNKIFRKLAIFCIPLVLGIVFYNIVQHPEKSSNSGALGVAYSSIKELNDKSLIIVKGSISSNGVEKRLATFKLIQYDFEIKGIIKNKGNINLKSNDKIKISNSVADDVIKEGEYMLFLNVVEDEGENYYVNNSLNNLYKYENKKYINVAVDIEKFKAEGKVKSKESVDSVKSDEIQNSFSPLLEFTEEELLNIEK